MQRTRRAIAAWIVVVGLAGGLGGDPPQGTNSATTDSWRAEHIASHGDASDRPPQLPLPPDVTVPSVTVPAVTLPAVTLPSVDVPAPPFMPTSQGLWLVDADQPSGRLISDATTANVSFSPDGSELAMTVETGKDSSGIPTRAVEVLDVSSGATRRLAPDARIPQAVQWSSDGQWIAFTTLPELNDGGGNSGYLWVVHPDGTGERRLSPSDGGWRLAWSPDSRRLAQPQPNLHDVAVIDVASGAVSPLSFDRATWTSASAMRRPEGRGWRSSATRHGGGL